MIGQGILTYRYDKLGGKVDCLSDQFSETIPPDGYDSAGNLLHKLRHDPLGDVDGHYSYDSLYQLTHEQGIAYHDYCYDSLNNRLSIDQYHSELDTLNQLLHQGELQVTYDINGNRSSRESTSLPTAYSYDSLGRLTDIHKGDNHYQYIYDSFNRRITKINCATGTTERYLYQGQSEIGMVDDSNSIVQLRILGHSQGAEIGAAVAIEMDKQVFVPIHDTFGHIAILLDIAGHLHETYRYSAFGEEISPSSPFLPWRFSCKRFDPETSLLYFGRRYYDPEVARWVTPDPRGYDDGPNFYAYVHNRPLTHHDLYGLASHPMDRDQSSLVLCRNPRLIRRVDMLMRALTKRDLSEIRQKCSDLGYRGVSQVIGETFQDATQLVPVYGLEMAAANGVQLIFQTKAVASMASTLFKSRLRPITPVAANIPAATERIIPEIAVEVNDLATHRFSEKVGQKVCGFTLDELSQAAQKSDREGLTRAGRALDKHGNRANTPFPKATGGPEQKNLQGQHQVDDVLTSPHSTLVEQGVGRGFEIYVPNGRGVRFDNGGQFKGFVEWSKR